VVASTGAGRVPRSDRRLACRISVWRRALAIVGVSLVFVAGATAARPPGLHAYRVTSAAMEPTVTVGETVYVAGRYRPRVGDVVVFNAPSGANALVCGVPPTIGRMCPAPTPRESKILLIARVAAGPGEEIAMQNGHTTLDGSVQAESYVDLTNCLDNPACSYPKPIRVPAGNYVMLNDNRGESGDSRFWGPVPLAWIVGRAQICSSSLTSCHDVP
jgi:signal peptidase I